MIRAALMAGLLPATWMPAETVVLQQGAGGYAGCTTRAIVDTRPAPEAGTAVLPEFRLVVRSRLRILKHTVN